jgi:hypothetical protein
MKLRELPAEHSSRFHGTESKDDFRGDLVTGRGTPASADFFRNPIFPFGPMSCGFR